MNSQTILVLDLVPQTLAVVRSLGRAGFHVVLGRNRAKKKSEVEWSRHCNEVWLHPEFAQLTCFGNALAALLDRRPEIGAIFPVAEPSIETLLALGSVRQRRIDIAMVSGRLFFACRDKPLANGLAVRAGLAVPESRVVKDIRSLGGAAESLGFPLIVKSPRTEARVHGRKAYVVACRSAFQAVFSEWPAGHHDLLVQRYIEGRLESCQFVASQGRLVGYCEVRVVRTDMPDGTGFGVVFESVPPTPDLLRAVRRFVLVHNYSGPGLMQFMRAERSGDLYFIENNPRLGAAIAHAIDSGQDCPWLALQAAMADAASLPEFNPEHTPYRYHYRSHWLMRDLASWVSLRAERDRRQQIEGLQQLIRSFLSAHGQIHWQWRDPLPSLCAYGKSFKRLAAKSFHRIFVR